MVIKSEYANDVGEILEALAAIRDLDESQARSLPAGFYASEEYLELEKEKIFRKEWVCLGPNSIGSLCLQPRGVGEVANRVTLSSFIEDPTEVPESRVEDFHKIMAEDRAQLALVRRGLMSRHVQPNRLGPPDLEGTVWDMFQYMARKLTPKKARRTKLKRAS